MTRPRPSVQNDAARRFRLREDGFKHGREGSPKRSREPEYLASYRRGREARDPFPTEGDWPEYEC